MGGWRSGLPGNQQPGSSVGDPLCTSARRPINGRGDSPASLLCRAGSASSAAAPVRGRAGRKYADTECLKASTLLPGLWLGVRGSLDARGSFRRLAGGGRLPQGSDSPAWRLDGGGRLPEDSHSPALPGFWFGLLRLDVRSPRDNDLAANVWAQAPFHLDLAGAGKRRRRLEGVNSRPREWGSEGFRGTPEA